MRLFQNRNRTNIIFAIIMVFIVMLFVALFSNKSHKDSIGNIDGLVSDWIGRTLILPDSVGKFTTNGDSLDTYFPKERFKVVRYISKEGCSSCKMHLSRYPEILKELSDSAKCEVGFVCIVNPADTNEIRRILRRDNYAGLTMWIDETDTINSMNQFPEIDALQTFLLDKDNKVLAIGDPAVNPRVMRLYTQILTSDTINPARLPYTSLSVENEEIRIGNVVVGDTSHIYVAVRNIGQNEFVLDKVITSCDCTTAELTPERIAPGEKAMLTIHFSESNAVGDFYRVVDIFGNIEHELSIELSGTVI